jgi:catechol 2,3-dioxygenase-like lactoylglutathione lyase family enzyme
MARVLGIGGVFFKAADPAALRAWYTRVLGFDVTDWGGALFGPLDRGHTVWSPFADDTTYFQPSAHRFMINLMVDDLDGVLARVTQEGVPILDRQVMGGMGRFAWIMDPEGIKIELWEPAEGG